MLGLLFYLYYWEPNLQKLHDLRQAVPEKKATLAWMEHQIEQARPYLNQDEKESDNRPILTLIERAAIKSEVKPALKRVQPGNQGEVKLWFEDAVADQWFSMIDFLTQYGITVDQANITRSTPGLVTARLTVSR